MKGIEAAKDFFSNIIKQTPAESYKKFKIDYDEKKWYKYYWNRQRWRINIMKKIKEFRIYLEIFKKTQKVYFILFQIWVEPY